MLVKRCMFGDVRLSVDCMNSGIDQKQVVEEPAWELQSVEHLLRRLVDFLHSFPVWMDRANSLHSAGSKHLSGVRYRKYFPPDQSHAQTHSVGIFGFVHPVDKGECGDAYPPTWSLRRTCCKSAKRRPGFSPPQADIEFLVRKMGTSRD
jgi:hypothetical protein